MADKGSRDYGISDPNPTLFAPDPLDQIINAQNSLGGAGVMYARDKAKKALIDQYLQQLQAGNTTRNNLAVRSLNMEDQQDKRSIAEKLVGHGSSPLTMSPLDDILNEAPQIMAQDEAARQEKAQAEISKTAGEALNQATAHNNFTDPGKVSLDDIIHRRANIKIHQDPNLDPSVLAQGAKAANDLGLETTYENRVGPTGLPQVVETKKKVDNRGAATGSPNAASTPDEQAVINATVKKYRDQGHELTGTVVMKNGKRVYVFRGSNGQMIEKPVQ